MRGRLAKTAVLAQVPAILGLAAPIVMGLAASMLIGVTDSIMLAPLGPVPLAAVGLTGAVAVLFYAAIYGLISALSVRIGAAWGAGEGRRISLILRSGLALGLLVGIGSAVVMAALWLVLPLLEASVKVTVGAVGAVRSKLSVRLPAVLVLAALSVSVACRVLLPSAPKLESVTST